MGQTAGAKGTSTLILLGKTPTGLAYSTSTIVAVVKEEERLSEQLEKAGCVEYDVEKFRGLIESSPTYMK